MLLHCPLCGFLRLWRPPVASYCSKMVLRRVNLRPRALGAIRPSCPWAFGLPIVILHFWSWMYSLFSLLGLWGKKNWRPNLNRYKLKIARTKWAKKAANGQVWMLHSLKPLGLIFLWNWMISFSYCWPSWGNKNWPPSMKMGQIVYCQNKMDFKGCK